MTVDRLSREDVARQADVDPSFVTRAVQAGALHPSSEGMYGPDDATRCRFLAAWDSAGLSVEAVGELVGRGEIEFTFLRAPFIAPARRLARTYADLADESGVSLATIQDLHEAIGFEPPAPDHRVRHDDLSLVDWAGTMLRAGFGEEAVQRLAGVYAAALRRVTIAEAEGYEAAIEDPLRAAGATEQDLFGVGGEMGERMGDLFEQTILDIYRRHRQHVWLDHSVGHVELILESKGLFERLDRPPCICFVDLTGFTRLTEERGDRTAAEVAARLEDVVGRISRRHAGRAVRWLGDGGMFVFQEAQAAVEAAVDITRQVGEAQLPPTHIGIHSGPIVFQDGDIYGRTVNVASRLSSHATAGEILISSAVADRLDPAVGLEPVGALDLKGVAEPVDTFRVVGTAPTASTSPGGNG